MEKTVGIKWMGWRLTLPTAISVVTCNTIGVCNFCCTFSPCRWSRVCKKNYLCWLFQAVVHRLSKQKSQFWWWLLIGKAKWMWHYMELLGKGIYYGHLIHKLVFWPWCGSTNSSVRAEDDPMKGAYKKFCVSAEQETVSVSSGSCTSES